MTNLKGQILGITAFGELSTAELTAQVQLQFPYNINTAQVIKFPGNGGSVTNGNNHANVSTGTNSNGFAQILSRDVLRYHAGQGALTRFTGLFTTGVANSEQIIGCGNGLNGFFFGYEDAAFGVLRRSGGMTEIRTLTITTASSTSEDITITLDGDTKTDVAVTASADPTVTAREIADASYASVGTGWGARVAGNVVTFISIEAATHTGSYSLSSATTAVGTFAQVAAGITPNDEWIAQTAWNVDKMDGAGVSGVTLDTTKGNVYQIQFQWLGYGMIRFGIENPATGLFQEVHRIEYANSATSPSVDNPTFPIFMAATNKGNTSNITVQSASMAAFTEGKDTDLGVRNTTARLFTIGATTAEEPILTIRNKQVYQSVINQVRLRTLGVTLTSNLGVANSNTTFRIYVQARPENGTSYSDISTSSSVVEVDKSAVDFDTTIAELKATFVLDQVQSIPIDFPLGRDLLAPGNTILITAQPSKSNANNEVGAAINWKELF